MEKEHNIKFFTQIPSWVDELEDINDFQARLLGYIYTFENITGAAFPSNASIAERFHKSPKSVQNSLSDLYKKGYLTSEKIYKPDSKIIEKRYLKTLDPHILKCVPYAFKNGEGSHSKVTGNRLLNKLNNNTVQKEFGRDDFEKLWKLYPRKEGKKVAYRAYQKAIKNGTTNKQIQDGIVAYKKMLASTERPADKVKMGSTWFNENCWEDEYETDGNQTSNRSSTVDHQDEISSLEQRLLDNNLTAAQRGAIERRIERLQA